jgi:uncharacterized protein (DUF2235 family)
VTEAGAPPAEPRNIVVCCDGTGNEVSGNLSNVLKLFRIAIKDGGQHVWYHPGVGTIGMDNAWEAWKAKVRSYWGMATGAGLDEDILRAYRFLVDTWRPGDRIFLFGFSRGAYTVRALAAFIQMIGLLPPDQSDIADYALTTYKAAGWRKEKEDAARKAAGATAAPAAGAQEPFQERGEDGFQAAWDFARIAGARRATIHFVGVWDTVSSMIVPGTGLLSLPKLRTLPYTRTNNVVRTFRHAMAIDERRRMFRLNRWKEGQIFVENPFVKPKVQYPQDCLQLWFAGVHSDVGGGYAEVQSSLSKWPLIWMVEEAKAHGLRIDEAAFRHLAWGDPEPGARHQYRPPNACGPAHLSLNGIWWLLEIFPKSAKWREWRRGFLGLYLPLGEPRPVPPDAHLHPSVPDRRAGCPGKPQEEPRYKNCLYPPYDPVNLKERRPMPPPEGPWGPLLRKIAVMLLILLMGLAMCALHWLWARHPAWNPGFWLHRWAAEAWHCLGWLWDQVPKSCYYRR